MTASDGTPGNATVSRTFRITVEQGVVPPPPPTRSDPPTARGGTITLTVEAGAFNQNTIAVFSDDGGAANLELVSVRLSDISPFRTVVVLNADGTIGFSDNIPNASTQIFEITVQDADGQQATQTVQLVVEAPSEPTEPPVEPIVSDPPSLLTPSTNVTFPVTVQNNEFTLNTGRLFADDGGAGALRIDVTQVASDFPGRISVAQTIRNGDGSVTFRESVVVREFTQSGRVTFDLTATDVDNQAVTVRVTLDLRLPSAPVDPVDPPTVIDNPPMASNLPTFTQTASVFGDVSLGVSRDFFVDDGGLDNLSLSLRGGFSPPDGTRVSISPDGSLVVAGTLRRPGTFIIPVEATDASGQSVTRTFRIVFEPGQTTPVIDQTDDANQVEEVVEAEALAPQPELRKPATIVGARATVNTPSVQATSSNPAKAENSDGRQIVSNETESTAPSLQVGPLADLPPDLNFDPSQNIDEIVSFTLEQQGVPSYSANYDEAAVFVRDQLVNDFNELGYSAWVEKYRGTFSSYFQNREQLNTPIGRELLARSFSEAVSGTPATTAGVLTAFYDEGLATVELLFPSTWRQISQDAQAALTLVSEMAQEYDVTKEAVMTYLAETASEAPADILSSFDRKSSFEQGRAMGALILAAAPSPGGKGKRAGQAATSGLKAAQELKLKLESGEIEVASTGRIVARVVDQNIPRSALTKTTDFSKLYAGRTVGNREALRQQLIKSDKSEVLSSVSDWQAHHVVPWDQREHPIVKKLGLNLNDPQNGVPLPSDFAGGSSLSTHRGSHPEYSAAFGSFLDRLDTMDAPNSVKQGLLAEAIEKSRQTLLSGSIPLRPKDGATFKQWSALLSQNDS